MEDTIITFETAKLAKKKGFNEICQYYYEIFDKPITLQRMPCSNSEGYEQPTAPTQSLLAKWLREEHNIYVTSQIGNLDFINTYHYEIRYIDKNKFMCKVNGNFKTYEEALEIGLQKALKYIS